MVRPWLNSTVMTNTEAETECEQNRTQIERHTAAHNGLQRKHSCAGFNGLGNLVHSDKGMSRHTNTHPKQAHTHTHSGGTGRTHTQHEHGHITQTDTTLGLRNEPVNHESWVFASCIMSYVFMSLAVLMHQESHPWAKLGLLKNLGKTVRTLRIRAHKGGNDHTMVN